MVYYCQVFNKKFLPAFRALLAHKLVREYGLTQTEVARLLGVKQSLVNYIITGRRKVKYAESLSNIGFIKQLVDETAEELASSKKTLDEQACKICRQLLKERVYEEVMKALGENGVIPPRALANEH